MKDAFAFIGLLILGSVAVIAITIAVMFVQAVAR